MYDAWEPMSAMWVYADYFLSSVDRLWLSQTMDQSDLRLKALIKNIQRSEDKRAWMR